MVDELVLNEFYYKNLWDSRSLVRIYLDNDGLLTKKPSAFYVNSYQGGMKLEDFVRQFNIDLRDRLQAHQEEYEIGHLGSQLGKYSEIIRRNTKDWN